MLLSQESVLLHTLGQETRACFHQQPKWVFKAHLNTVIPERGYYAKNILKNKCTNKQQKTSIHSLTSFVGVCVLGLHYTMLIKKALLSHIERAL